MHFAGTRTIGPDYLMRVTNELECMSKEGVIDLRYRPRTLLGGGLRKTTECLPKYESISWSLEPACTAEDEHGAAYY